MNQKNIRLGLNEKKLQLSLLVIVNAFVGAMIGLERSMNIYLKAFKSPQGKLIPLAKLAAGSKFSEKYLNLLARSGKLEAHTEGRNWVSSKEALAKYLDTRERKRD